MQSLPIAAAAADGGSLDLVLLGVLAGVTALLVLAYHSRVPYPILLVVGGGALAFVPGLPDVDLDPDLVLVVILPPLLYSAAFFSSLRDLRAELAPIGLLAVGLVVVTTLAVGLVAHAFVNDLSWAAAFTLGAVLSPTDPVAATAIAARAGAPRRFVTVVEGESLLNDSSALILYKAAVAAVLTGSFSLLGSGVDFVVGAAAGIAIGILVGAIVARVRSVVDDPPTEITISLMTPYFAYLPAEALGVSAVLAAVTAGIWLGWRSPQLITPQVRIQSFSVWEILTFVLNAALFVLVGLQLPQIVETIADQYPVSDLVWWSALTVATVVATRFVWVFATAYLPRLISRHSRWNPPGYSLPLVALTAWTGMRGAVSLAAALAIPLTVEGGAPFPDRDLIVFLVYTTIFTTIVVQGLSLAPLLRWSGVEDDGRLDRLEAKARIKAAKSAIARIDELAGEEWVREDSADRLRSSYEFRIRRFRSHLDDAADDGPEQRSRAYQVLRRQVLEAERAEVIRLRDEGVINDEVLRRIQRDLDFEDARLDVEAGSPLELVPAAPREDDD
ncbi:Na+/H+ antiporter [Conexibacter sp. JD483]|uniref:Na+/H+ antiporter n=1 Tax=unclassified Conexibacter TaxID=2627773 RepID=UPI00272281EC|nr:MULTISPECIES: Na+/H+ antiporter [unclassified Conexibacter]MDO8187444.1 Na+/H+ antiporter [Conexibacter sp. CPCC 205706]MDO8198678.1 Na+/H+ antiporter [Conexibacter sp. CPCC 205762]MDR9369856.1 Na+/H+ antiporter [Conexibacter sp. JD483]